MLEEQDKKSKTSSNFLQKSKETPNRSHYLLHKSRTKENLHIQQILEVFNKPETIYEENMKALKRNNLDKTPIKQGHRVLASPQNPHRV